MAHPHKKEALEGHAHKATKLSGGKMTAGAESGPGRLQKAMLQASHPVLDDGGQPSNYADLGPSAPPPTTPMMPDDGGS